MKLIRVAAIAVSALACAAAVPAQPGAGAMRVAGSPPRLASVTGSAWKQDNTPIPGARLQLRDLENGRIAATTLADDGGRFTFSGVHNGTYAVELVDEHGRIATAGHPFAIGPSETVATFVRLGSRAPWFAGFFSNAAAAVASTAASQGITALAPVQLPVSAGSGS